MASKVFNKKIYSKLKDFYPVSYTSNKLPEVLSKYFKILNKKIKADGSIISGKLNKGGLEKLKERYSTIPKKIVRPLEKSSQIIDDFFGGALKWRSPELQYNVGSPVNTLASAVYSMSLDENIYNIDDGLAGNAIIAESAVCSILSKLAGLTKNATGFFTFGGSATNLYAMKVGLIKATKNSRKTGTSKDILLFVTKNAHFSHYTGADWLGIGTDNIVVMDQNADGTTNIIDAEIKMEEAFSKSKRIAAIMLNGGTTYDQTVDNIREFYMLREKLVKKHSLDYNPHLHADTVIGWGWLFFREYDFKSNKLRLDKCTATKIKEQSNLVGQLKYADSWGVDFHKGIGGCPIPCSTILFNSSYDIGLLSKKSSSIDLHQLAIEFNQFSPADFTLETSRPAGAPLAALTCLHTLGIEGYQRNLANLIKISLLTKKLLGVRKDFSVMNHESKGFCTMVRIYPPELMNDQRRWKETSALDHNTISFIKEVNEYVKSFFNWDNETRMSKDKGIRYSCSSAYKELEGGIKITTLKFYPNSPHITEAIIKKAVTTIIQQKVFFDKKIWKNKILKN